MCGTSEASNPTEARTRPRQSERDDSALSNTVFIQAVQLGAAPARARRKREAGRNFAGEPAPSLSLSRRRRPLSCLNSSRVRARTTGAPPLTPDRSRVSISESDRCAPREFLIDDSLAAFAVSRARWDAPADPVFELSPARRLWDSRVITGVGAVAFYRG